MPIWATMAAIKAFLRCFANDQCYDQHTKPTDDDVNDERKT
jgi:hypothetical protein